jgi:hypothetical protein
MVVESDRAGDLVTCPNCKRTLKVPSGKDRGVELSSAPKVRSSRTCPHCQTEAPVDAQTCPNCKGSLTDEAAFAPAAGSVSAAAAAAEAVRSASRAAVARPGTEGSEGTALRYGSLHASAWSRSSDGTKIMIIGGIALGVLVFGAIIGLAYRYYVAGELSKAKTEGQAAITDGRKLEILGKFQDAYMKYSMTWQQNALRGSQDPADVELAETISQRYKALIYLVHDAQIRKGEMPYWKPASAEELAKESANLRANYLPYQQMCLNVAAIAMSASEAAQKDGNRAAYEAKIGQAMDAFVTLVNKSTIQQRSTLTFQQLIEGVKRMTNAVREWDKPEIRKKELIASYKYLEALKERVEMTDPFGDNFWQH